MGSLELTHLLSSSTSKFSFLLKMKTIFRCVIVTLLMTTFAFAKLKRDKVAVNNKFREDDTAAVVAAKQAEDGGGNNDCPQACTMEFMPVCDSNGNTHGNKCVFEID